MPGHKNNKALAYALKLLGYRPRSRWELRQRLRQKGFEDKEAELTIDQLQDHGYVDDLVAAKSFRDHAERVKLLGRSGAKMFLRQRGIDSENIEQALEDYDEEGTALKLLERKRGALNRLPRHVARRRLAGYLMRRGYSGESLKRVLKAALNDNE